MPRRRVLVVSLAFLTCLAARAQYKLGSVSFTPLDGYASADLLAVTGLHVGQALSNAELKAAAQHLSDTGYFGDIRIETKGPPAGMEVFCVLKPQPPERMTPVGFANFVWLTAAEVQTAIHRVAPLFHGELPEAGNQPDAVAAALTAALAGKGINGHVTHEPLEPSLTQPMRAIEFRVELPVVLSAVALHGVPPELEEREQMVARELKGESYGEGLNGASTLNRLLAPLADAGYLEAAFVDLERTVQPIQLPAGGEARAGAPARVQPAFGVAVTASVVPGPTYHVAQLAYAGTEIAPAADMFTEAKLHPGDVASRRQLLQTEQPIEADYKRLGYMDVYIKPGARLDHAAHTVSYSLEVVPGTVYRLRSVTPVGLTQSAQEEFGRAWKLQPGEVYNPEYVAHFLRESSSLRAFAASSATFRASADPETHTVDLTLTFVTGAR